MPTYDYQCRSCGHVIEVIHAMTDDGPSVCERCGGSLRRVLYPAGIIFKGSGFYVTDSRKGASSSSNGGSSDGAAKKTSTDASAKTETTSTPTSGAAKGGDSAA